jgi:hypothetical protein
MACTGSLLAINNPQAAAAAGPAAMAAAIVCVVILPCARPDETRGVRDAGDDGEADHQAGRSTLDDDALPGVERVPAAGLFHHGCEAGSELVDDGDAGRMNSLDRVIRHGVAWMRSRSAISSWVSALASLISPSAPSPRR